MDKQKQYLVTLSLMLVSVSVGLGSLGEARLEVYYSLMTVCYFAASALFRPRRRWFDVVGGSLFLGFCYIVLVKVLEIIG
ncbi:MAG: hypothetical protein NWE89_13480 [Candidatus Bathyarchaeota archaeon]|nr:hypothetical protein [Candidatus Bathyarchaeota archaeon]